MVSPSRVKHEVVCSECGKSMLVRADYLKKHSGICMSCQKIGNSNAKKHGDTSKRIYHIWVGLFHRRYRVNPDVCDEWHDYNKFKDWSISNGYKDNLTIDRIDNSGGYSPLNCQWITLAENAGKDKMALSNQEKLEVIGKRKSLGMTQKEYAEHIGVSRNTIQRAERYFKEVNNGLH